MSTSNRPNHEFTDPIVIDGVENKENVVRIIKSMGIS